MIKGQCTWKVQGDRPVTDAVVYFEDNENIDLEDAISAENCIQLEAPVEDDITANYVVPACQILLSCNDTHAISSISILSEARIIEVYGNHGEYLNTVKNELMEEVDGMAVFRGDIALDRPMKECCLKFIPMKSKVTMWLYGIKVVVQKHLRTEAFTPFPASIPLKDVEQRLGASGSQISDKAEALKKMMETFQSTNPYLSMLQHPQTQKTLSSPLLESLPLSPSQNNNNNLLQLFSCLQNTGPYQQANPLSPREQPTDLFRQLASMTNPVKESALMPNVLQQQELERNTVLKQLQQMLQPAPVPQPPQQDAHQDIMKMLLDALQNTQQKEKPQPVTPSPPPPVQQNNDTPVNKILVELLQRPEILNNSNATTIIADLLKLQAQPTTPQAEAGKSESNQVNSAAGLVEVLKPASTAISQQETAGASGNTQPEAVAGTSGITNTAQLSKTNISVASTEEVKKQEVIVPQKQASVEAVVQQQEVVEPPQQEKADVTKTKQEDEHEIRENTHEKRHEAAGDVEENRITVIQPDPEEVFQKYFLPFQNRLITALEERFEDLQCHVTERIEQKVQEMEDRINARFDAIIDALQGQDDGLDEETYEQPEEGSV